MQVRQPLDRSFLLADLLKLAAQLFCMALPRTARDRIMNRRRPPTLHASPSLTHAPPFLEERASRGFLRALPYSARGELVGIVMFTRHRGEFFFFFDVEIFVSRPLYILVSSGYSSFSAVWVGALQYCRTSRRRWRRRRRRFPALTCSISAVRTVPVLVTRCYMPLLLPEQVLHRALLQKVSYALQAQGTNKSQFQKTDSAGEWETKRPPRNGQCMTSYTTAVWQPLVSNPTNPTIVLPNQRRSC